MLMLTIILALLLIGLTLIVVELVFVPGTTVVGLLGAIFAIAGVIISYRHFGSEIGFYFLIGTATATLGSMWYAFRSGSWSKFSLKTSNDGKVNEGLTSTLSIGDTGVTTSTLRPIGKAEINQRQYEVKTSGNYIETGTEVRIIKIEMNQIIVEPTKINL